MAAPLAALIVRVLADTSELVTGMQTVTASVQGVERGVGQANTQLSGLYTMAQRGASILAGSWAVDKVRQWTSAVIEAGAEYQKLAAMVDDTATNTQRLEAISADYSVTLETLIGAIQTLQAKLASGDADAALKRLNLNVTELHGLRPVELYLQVAAAIGEIPTAGGRALVAQELLGKSAKALAGTFRTDLAESAQPWLAVTEEGVDAMDALDVTFARAIQSAKSFGIELLANASGAKAYVLALKEVNSEGERLLEWEEARTRGRSFGGNIQLNTEEPFAARPTPDTDALDAAMASAVSRGRELTELSADQYKWTMQLAEAWQSVKDRVTEINAEMRIGLTVEGQSLNNAIAKAAILRQSSEAESAAIIQRMQSPGGTEPSLNDRVNEIIARADRAVAGIDPNIESGRNAIHAEYERANLEVQEMLQGLNAVKSGTDAIGESAKQVAAQFGVVNGSISNIVAQMKGGGYGWIDQQGNQTTQGASEVLANMPKHKSWSGGGFMPPAGGGGVGPSITNHLTLNGAIGAGKEDLRRMLDELLMERATLGTKRPGAR
jgi:hypothetical protein